MKLHGLVTPVARRLGRRGSALLFFAFIDVIFSLALFFPNDSAAIGATFEWFGSIMNPAVWGALWLIVAACCVYAAFMGGHTTDWIGFAPAIGIKMLWGMLCIAGWALGDIWLGWVPVWLGFAAFVGLIAGWPEPVDVGEDPL